MTAAPTVSGRPSTRTTRSLINRFPGVAPNIASAIMKYAIATNANHGQATEVLVEKAAMDSPT